MNAVFDLKFLSAKTQTTREYNLVRRTFYDVNYMYMYIHGLTRRKEISSRNFTADLRFFWWLFSARGYFRTKI